MLQNVVIPETVYEMDTSVFERSGLYYQKLPQSITAIGSWTFKDCPNLVKVECSDNLETIGDYAFERCASFTTLQTAAKEVPFNNTTFKDCPQFIDPRFYVFNPAKTGIESTGNIGTDHTLVHFTVRYDIRDDWKDEDLVMQKLWLNYPDSFDIVTTSFAAEGFDFDNASYTGDYKSFSLTGGKSSGELRFSAYVNSADAAARDFSAEVEFTHKGTGFRKPIGKVSFTTAKLSIFAPSSVTTPAQALALCAFLRDNACHQCIGLLGGRRQRCEHHDLQDQRRRQHRLHRHLPRHPEQIHRQIYRRSAAHRARGQNRCQRRHV